MFDDLLNQEIEIDVELLNNLCIQARSGNQKANDILLQVKERPDLYSIFDDVMSADADEYTKMLLLQTINNIIKYKWNLLQDQEKESLTNSIIQYIDAYAAAEVSPGIKSAMNLAFASLIIIHLPDETYFTPLLNLTTTEFHLYNNLQILIIFFEEVFEDEKVWLTSVQRNTGKLFIQSHAQQIFSYTLQLIQSTGEELILSRVFSSYKYFINFISLETLGEADFFNMICQGYLQSPNFMPFILDTIDSIFGVDELPEILLQLVPQVFSTVTETVMQVLPPNDDFEVIDPDSGIKIIAEALKLFPSKYPSIVEVEELAQPISLIAQWFCSALNVDDIEVFRTSNDYWNSVLHRYSDKKNPMVEGFKQIYNEVLPHVSRLLMQKMPRPPEVLIVVDSMGGITRDTQKETLEASLFQVVRQNLVIISHIDIEDTILALTEMNNQISSNFDSTKFNSLYWSIGAISGTMKKEKERDFISTILLPLISLCDSTRDENTRAIIAAGIMYICSQYPRFITLNMELFHKIIFKLFDFMGQDVPGIKEMAVQTFNTIGKKAKIYFCNDKEQTPFIFEIIDHIHDIMNPLENLSLRASIYDTISNIANGAKNQNIGINVIKRLTDSLNVNLSVGSSYLDGDNVENVQFSLDCHRFIAMNNPLLYVPTLNNMSGILNGIYSTATQTALNCMKETGNRMWMTSFIRLKSCVLQIYLQILPIYSKSPVDVKDMISSMLMNLLENIVTDYIMTHDEIEYLMENDQPQEEKQMRPGFILMDLRVPEVLDIMSLVCTDIQDALGNQVIDMFCKLVEATYPMLGQRNNYNSYPQIRPALFKMISLFVSTVDLETLSNFIDILTLIDIVQRGEDHPGYDSSAPSFKAMSEIVTKYPKSHDTVEVFQSIFLHAFSTLTDATHKVVFEEQVSTLRSIIINICQIPDISAEILTAWLVDGNVFPNIDVSMTLEAVQQLMRVVEDPAVFRTTIRDILVESKVFTATDPELRLLEAEQLKEIAEQQVSHIPGIEGPAAVDANQVAE